MALPGSVYLYQGEELGLPDVWDLPPDVLDDPVWKMSNHEQKGRDGCRVPIPWTSDGPSFGFGAGPAWLPQPAFFADLSAATQVTDKHSTLSMYRAALALRRTHFIADEHFEWIDVVGQALAFRRGSGAVCIVNFGTEPVALPDGELLIASAPLDGRMLPGNAAAWTTG